MNIKMYALNLGYFDTDMEMILTGHPDLVLQPEHRERKKVRYKCPSLGFIVEHPEGRILFETGTSPYWRDEWPEEYKKPTDWGQLQPEDFLQHKLELMGLGPEDFRYVVVGHLHCDHAGGLRLFEKAGAEILIHEDEYKGALSLEEDENFMARADFEFLPRKKPTLIYGEQEIMTGVRLTSVPGHTWGTMGMLTRLEHTGWVFFPTDALHHHKTYGPPVVGSFLLTMFLDKWASSVEKIRRLSKKYEALIVPGHDETGIRQHADGATDLVQLEFYPDHVYE